MQLTPEQVKGRIRNVAKENKADARTLMRIYMMERFWERVANSRYKDNFIIKGGMLVTAMVGVANRSTMDIDTSLIRPRQEDGVRITVITTEPENVITETFPAWSEQIGVGSGAE